MMQRLTLPVGANVYGLGRALRPLRQERPVGRHLEPGRRDGQRAGLQVAAVPRDRRGLRRLREQPGPGVLRGVLGGRLGRAVLGAGRRLEYLVIHGPTPRQILEKYTALTGRPALPPRWSFGLWLSTSFLTDYDEATVTHFVDGMRERDIPLSVVHFDCYWMKPLQWCDFEWDRDAFPDPEGMLQRLGEQGPAAQRVDQPLHRPAVAAVRRGGPGGLPRPPARRLGVAVGPVGRRHGPGRLHQPGRARRGSPARCARCSTRGSTPSRPTSASASPPTSCGTTAPTRP